MIYRDLKLGAFHPQIYMKYPSCPRMHQWWKFGELALRNIQDIVLAISGMDAQTNVER